MDDDNSFIITDFLPLFATEKRSFHDGCSVNEKIPLSWEVGYHNQPGLQPGQWFQANVPGAVQLDLLETLGNSDK